MAFRGSSVHTIDEKGRIVIPARFRAEIMANGGDKLILTRKMETCLQAYPLRQWMAIEERYCNITLTDSLQQRYRRLFIGFAKECTIDRQGRLLIPKELRTYARLEKDIILIGNLEYFEIWSQEEWEKEVEDLAEELKKEEAREKIAALG